MNSFWKKLTQSNKVQTPSSKIQELLPYDEMFKITESLHGQGKYRTAMDNIIHWLDVNPAEKKSILELAALVMYSGMGRTSATYESIEPLTEDYIIDRRFDSIFCECNKCGRGWVLNPIMKVAKGSLSNPPGGQCPLCNKVFCRECSVGENVNYHCPNCHIALEIVREPNGRTSQQLERRNNIEMIFFFREGLIPPNAEYVQKWIKRLSPDALEQKKQPEIIHFPNWTRYNEESLLREAGNITLKKRKKMPDNGSIELDSVFARDENGSVIYVMKTSSKNK